MSQSRANSDPSAIGFWKFVIVTTIVLVLARGGPDFFGKIGSSFPLAVFLWVAYRVGRVQEWWPFATSRPDSSRIEAVAKFVKSGPPQSEVLRQMAKNANLTRKAETKFKANLISKKVSSITSVPSVAFLERTKEPDAFKLLGVTVSSVGVRSKSVRAKTNRGKVVRSKRPQGSL